MLENMITTEQFVDMVIRAVKCHTALGNNGLNNSELENIKSGKMESEQDDNTILMNYALHKGIIEDYDLTNKGNPIERRRAARIIHEILKTELSENDENDWSAAEKLLDLYSCRTCVMHIAQVYVKGIMPGHKDNLFDVNGNLTWAEAKAIVERMLHKEQRTPQQGAKKVQCIILEPHKAMELMLGNKKALLIDVRTQEEYKQGHIAGSICIPLHDLALNPYMVSARKDIPIILYCQKGYKSKIAAQTLIDAGYTNIYTIPGIEQYDYILA